MRAIKIKHSRNPADRSLLDRLSRRFILPPFPPRALPLGGWDKREAKLKRHYPIRFFVWDTVPDFYRSNVSNRWKRIRNWFRFRLWDRYHVVKLEISKDYHDPDTRLFYANFQILKDFVEIELASMMSTSDGDHEDAGHMLKKFGKRLRWRRRRGYRNPAEGLKHLDWEIAETGGHQAASAAEKKALYLWWTQERPMRVDVYDSPLFHDPEEDDISGLSLSAVLARPYNKDVSDRRRNLEKFYEEQDEEMLIRLIKIRKSLWT